MPSLFHDGELIELAERLPVLPLRDVVLFPHVVMPLLVGRPASLAAIAAAAEQDHLLLLVAQKDGEVQDPSASDLHRVGVVARLHQLSRLPNGTTKVLVEGLGRVRVTRYVNATGVLSAAVSPFGDGELALEDGGGTRALARRVVTLFEEYVSLHRRIPNEVVGIVQGTEAIDRQAFG